MADGASLNVSKARKKISGLRNLSTSLDAKLDAASQKNSEEFVETARRYTPRDTGNLAQSLVALKDPKDSIWGIYGDFYWFFVENGTAPGVRGQKTRNAKGNSRTARRTHPGSRPRPFIFTTYRILKERFHGRYRRAINKAIKEVIG
ncbi:HK97 gp10 family phage protein [Cohaesibacter gelatinilyticus]|uniref:Phage protein, HK97 gp10 family n=1 Tax=Cohaesibacter gelatinilyticus TaxID=372072 RepID=A0A285PJ33_9HYPH|nr:HK97 gp10 family phage protein [Cohaesibacter gelatinilyticus]SNZ21724.1 phage protein, HK97 gp10 family [Cohaesibacter gelatinilyticus]